jgi:chorismate mutase-like protein
VSEDGLDTVRRDIDVEDLQFVKALKRRLKLARRAGELKRKADLPIHDPNREREVLALRRDWAEQLGVDPDVVEDFFRLLIEQSRKAQEEDEKGTE